MLRFVTVVACACAVRARIDSKASEDASDLSCETETRIKLWSFHYETTKPTKTLVVNTEPYAEQNSHIIKPTTELLQRIWMFDEPTTLTHLETFIDTTESNAIYQKVQSIKPVHTVTEAHRIKKKKQKRKKKKYKKKKKHNHAIEVDATWIIGDNKKPEMHKTILKKSLPFHLDYIIPDKEPKMYKSRDYDKMEGYNRTTTKLNIVESTSVQNIKSYITSATEPENLNEKREQKEKTSRLGVEDHSERNKEHDHETSNKSTEHKQSTVDESDRNFLLSLLPFLKELPRYKKIPVEQKLLDVFSQEENSLRTGSTSGHLSSLIGLDIEDVSLAAEKIPSTQTSVPFLLYPVPFRSTTDPNQIYPLLEQDPEDSSERIGPVVTQVYRHPYAGVLLKNGTYECSAVILNTYWILTLSKCFDSEVTSTYVNHKNLNNYTFSAGSSYNNKGGSYYALQRLVNNFDLKVTAVKLEHPLQFGETVQAVSLPKPDEELSLGYLASIIAWTPDGHMRLVNVPTIDASICEDLTKLLPGHYICVAGVQDPNRNFCRKDNGGAVIQNGTLIALATFHQTCAIYTRPHAFPKAASFSRWLDSVIWDEDNRPTASVTTTERLSTEATPEPTLFFIDPSKYMLTLPYDPVNVPLEPGEDNSVIPRISLYESYLQNLQKSKTSTTTHGPIKSQDTKMEWFKKYGKAIMMMSPHGYMRHDQYDYN